MRFGDSELKGHTVGDVQQKVGHLELVAGARVSNLGIVCLEQVKATIDVMVTGKRRGPRC